MKVYKLNINKRNESGEHVEIVTKIFSREIMIWWHFGVCSIDILWQALVVVIKTTGENGGLVFAMYLRLQYE